jgi:hypothetical protein
VSPLTVSLLYSDYEYCRLGGLEMSKISAAVSCPK